MAEAELEQPAAEEEPPPVAVVPLAFTFALTPASSAAPPAEARNKDGALERRRCWSWLTR